MIVLGAMTEKEWRFEKAIGAVIAHHASGFSVRLPNTLGSNAKVMSMPVGMTKNDRIRLIGNSRKVFEAIYGRTVWMNEKGLARLRP